jgi:hypothetical protein
MHEYPDKRLRKKTSRKVGTHPEMTMPEINSQTTGIAEQSLAQPASSSSSSILTPVGPIGFSVAGAAEYTKASQNYLIALELASRAVAKYKKSDSVSEFHVQIAVDALGGDQGNRIRRISEVGSLLIGAGLGYLAMVIYGSSYTFKNALILFTPLLIGFTLYSYSWGRR